MVDVAPDEAAAAADVVVVVRSIDDGVARRSVQFLEGNASSSSSSSDVRSMHDVGFSGRDGGDDVVSHVLLSPCTLVPRPTLNLNSKAISADGGGGSEQMKKRKRGRAA